MTKRKVYVKVRPYIKRVNTKLGKKQRVIKAHKRLVIRDFDRPHGKEEVAKEFFVHQFNKSPETEKQEFDKWKKRIEPTKNYHNPIKARARLPQSIMKKYEKEDEDDYQTIEFEEEERKRKYGLDTFGFDSDSHSQIIKEQNGIALVKHHDSASPSSEHPDVWEIREEGGNPLWNSGTTYMAEFVHEGLGTESVSPSIRKEAEQKFEDILKKKRPSPVTQKSFGSFTIKKGDRILLADGGPGIVKGFDKEKELVNIDFGDKKIHQFHKSWIQGKGEPGKPQFKEGNEEVNFGSFPSGGIKNMERFREINDLIRRRKDNILMGSDTLHPETARKIAKDDLVREGKIKRSELKNLSSSPTTGNAKPSDTFLVNSLQRNKKLKQKSEFRKKFGIDLGDTQDLESK